MDGTAVDLEALARKLEASGDYRVLRRLKKRSIINAADGSDTRNGLFVDVETTGLDPQQDDIIELAMVSFTYGLDGRIFEIRRAFQGFHQPRKPIPPEVTRLTGITDDMVRGHKLDPADVAAYVEPSALVIAHNAIFDRRFLERSFRCFAEKPWACSMSQVNWQDEGYDGVKLSYLAASAGFFYDRHRASEDCIAAIELLATKLPTTQTLALARLLESARRPSWRIWAEGSPFELKDVLKARGYRWSGDQGAIPRAWYLDVDDDMKESELSYLKSEIYRRAVELPIKRLTAMERFSERS